MLQYDSEGNSSADSGSEGEGEGEYDVDDGDGVELNNADGSPADAAADAEFWHDVAETGVPDACACRQLGLPW